MADVPATPPVSSAPASTKPPQVQLQPKPKPAAPPPQPKKNDYFIDAVFCSGCGEFMSFMTSYVVDPSLKASPEDPTPVFHGAHLVENKRPHNCYEHRASQALKVPPALPFVKNEIGGEAVYKIPHSQLPERTRKPRMMDA